MLDRSCNDHRLRTTVNLLDSEIRREMQVHAKRKLCCICHAQSVSSVDRCFSYRISRHHLSTIDRRSLSFDVSHSDFSSVPTHSRSRRFFRTLSHALDSRRDSTSLLNDRASARLVEKFEKRFEFVRIDLMKVINDSNVIDVSRVFSGESIIIDSFYQILKFSIVSSRVQYFFDQIFVVVINFD